MYLNKEKEELKSFSHSNINILQNNFLDLNNSKTESIKNIEDSYVNIEKKIKRFNWIDFLSVMKLKIKKNNYFLFLYKKRNQIISEENIIKEYFIIKNLKDIVINTIFNNYNVNNNLSIINSKKTKNQIN